MMSAEPEKKIGSLNEMNLLTLTKFIDFLLFSQQHASVGQHDQQIDLDEDVVNNLRKDTIKRTSRSM